jgi:putative phosphoesterase
MKIIVLADTHMPKRAKALPETVRTALADADHIIHAGDITDPAVLDMLAGFAPITAVAGNADPPELSEALGEKKLLFLDGFRFGIYHGHGSKGKTLDRALNTFTGQTVDAIIFGHSHNPYLERHGGVLVMNPGSPTDKRRNAYYSYGVIETGEKLSGHIMYFDKDGGRH